MPGPAAVATDIQSGWWGQFQQEIRLAMKNHNTKSFQNILANPLTMKLLIDEIASNLAADVESNSINLIRLLLVYLISEMNVNPGKIEVVFAIPGLEEQPIGYAEIDYTTDTNVPAIKCMFHSGQKNRSDDALHNLAKLYNLSITSQNNLSVSVTTHPLS